MRRSAKSTVTKSNSRSPFNQSAALLITGKMDQHSPLCAADGLLNCCSCHGLLDDPRQLQCLHNCCSKCANKIAAKESGRSVKCPECAQVTNIKDTVCSYFIAARVSRFKALTDAKNCGVCQEEGNASQPALVWCASCRRSLCAECMPGHVKYNRTHTTVLLDEVHSWDDACPAPVAMCQQHAKPFDLMCLTCEAMRCVDCWVSCNKGRHNVQHIGDASVSDYVTKIRNDLQRRQSDLQRKLPQLNATIGLPEDVDRAQDAAMVGLKQRKQQVMAAVDEAHAAAAESIRNTFDSVRAKVAELSSAAESLNRKVSYTLNYGNVFAKTGETCSMIHQRKHILGQFLVLSDEIDAMRPSINVSDMVTVKVSLPVNLVDVLAAWMGVPQLTADEPLEDSGQTQEPSSTARRCDSDASAAAAVSVAQFMPQQTAGDADAESPDDPKVLSVVASGCNSLKVSGECWDVAVTPEGHLLLAALWLGLKELVVSSGRELTVWKPTGESSSQSCQKWVTRVDCLPDGRAVVASSYKDRDRASESTVSLLRPVRSRVSGAESTVSLGYRFTGRFSDNGSSTYTEQRLFVGLKSPVHQLSASGDILALVESKMGGRSWIPGRRVTLLSLSSNKTFWQRKLDYHVQSVAVAEQLVVTASSERLALSSGRARYVVDGHSLDGDRLWRQALTEQVNDLCCAADNWTQSSPERRLELYLAQSDGLWSIEVGHEAGDAESRDSARVSLAGYTERSEPSKPARVSISRGRTAIVATLSENWHTVTACAATKQSGRKGSSQSTASSFRQ